MEDSRKVILIVDDEKLNINFLKAILDDAYKVIPAKSGEQAFNRIANNPPDLILLDIVMPEMDGFEVCRRIKQDTATADIPVIFVTARQDEENERKGLELGAIDYITKPFSPPIVKTRVRNHIKLSDSMVKLKNAMAELERLYGMALDANPMTKLPGNNSVAARIEKALNENEKVCIIYSDLDNFKAFNDKYGFALGDKAILFTCQVFKDAVALINIPDAFIGHIGGDDFVVIVPSEHIEATTRQIIEKFDQGIVNFYSLEDARAGCINSVNRQGKPEVFPLMSISLAGLDLSRGVFTNYVEVNDACAGAKKMAKAIPGSSFFLDRRMGR